MSEFSFRIDGLLPYKMYKTLSSTLFSDEKVCFSAYVNYAWSNFGSRTVIYNRTVTNIGSAYNPVNGIFTAPRSGTYLFMWNSMVNGGASWKSKCDLYLIKNGRGLRVQIAKSEVPANTQSSSSSSMSTVLELVAGDTIWVHAGYSNIPCDSLYGGNRQYFTGCEM